MMGSRWVVTFFLVWLFSVTSSASTPVEATSLLGEPLHQPVLSEAVRQDFETKLEMAKLDLEQKPLNVESWIWFGRRTAYLGRYQEAIDIYTKALSVAPDDARLYRHRGHRFLSTRQIKRAIADFEKAVSLVQGKPDQVEPDGLPNAQNIPTSTLQTNIWYHLGLAQYLLGDFESAEDSYRKCLARSKNDDMYCATAHWLYMTLRRQDKRAAASAVLDPIHSQMQIIENEGYYQLLLAYKDPERMDQLRSLNHEDGVQSATTAYGLANWWFYEGDSDKANQAFHTILKGSAWAAFGFLAAEAELARQQPSVPTNLERDP